MLRVFANSLVSFVTYSVNGDMKYLRHHNVTTMHYVAGLSLPFDNIPSLGCRSYVANGNKALLLDLLHILSRLFPNIVKRNVENVDNTLAA